MGGFAETEGVSCVSFMGDSSGSLSAERSSVDSSVDSFVGSVGGTLVVSSVEGGLGSFPVVPGTIGGVTISSCGGSTGGMGSMGSIGSGYRGR